MIGVKKNLVTIPVDADEAVVIVKVDTFVRFFSFWKEIFKARCCEGVTEYNHIRLI